jgi:poly(3-hydroxybutyrate) depolymerase
MKNLLLGLCLVMSICAPAQQIARGLTASNGQFIGFYEYKPTDYDADPTIKYPLIIFLHGIGERGNGTTELSRVRGNAIPKYIHAGHKMRFYWNGKWETFLVLSPQLSSGDGWWHSFYVEEMIKYAKANLRIDTNRISLTGLSLGGGGVWIYSTTPGNAQKLASIGAICPTCDFVTWCNIGSNNLPTWAFHATNDGTIPYTCTSGAINQIGACAGNQAKPYLTLFSTGGHSIWDASYDTTSNTQPNIFEWFLGQNKSLPVNKRPKANAGNNLVVSTSTARVTLSAVGSTDQDGVLVRYVWRRISGPNTGNFTSAVSTNGRTDVINMNTAGVFQYEVKAIDDRADYGLDTVTVTMVSGSTSNISPIAQAGPDRNTDMSLTTLDGSNSYDPDGNISSYQWTKIAGPAFYNFSSATAVNPTVSDMLLGTYSFELRTTDNLGAVSRDTVVVNSTALPLAVKLRTFKASSVTGGTELSWITERENGNDYFVIERSEDGTNFTSIGTIDGEEQSTTLKEYTLTDPQVATGVVYYRLRQVSVDGKGSYLQTVTISGKASMGSGIHYFPNPVRSGFTVQARYKETGLMKINLYSLDGRLIKQKQLLKQEELVSTAVDIRELGKGVYMLEVLIGDQLRETMKLVKQ